MSIQVAKQGLTLDLNHIEETASLCRALGAPIRLEILKALIRRAMSISEIAEEFHLAISSASLHVKVLQRAGILHFQPKPGTRGTQKLCSVRLSAVHIDFFLHRMAAHVLPPSVESIPVGAFMQCDVKAPSGLASAETYLAEEDVPYSFYSNAHLRASLLWFTSGYVQYQFSNRALHKAEASRVDIILEICSEAPGFDNDWPSDITFWINGFEVGTFRSRGDFGDRRGLLNPEWWSDSLTQYGELKQLSITHDGCLLDGRHMSGYTIDSLGLANGYCCYLRVGVKEDAECVGGVNLFGRSFGNYPNDILVKVSY